MSTCLLLYKSARSARAKIVYACAKFADSKTRFLKFDGSKRGQSRLGSGTTEIGAKNGHEF